MPKPFRLARHQFWGNITGEEMVDCFRTGTVYGGYVGYGDTFKDPQDILWWAKGGTLRGESSSRLAFLRKILEDSPAEGLNSLDRFNYSKPPFVGKAHEHYLSYFGTHRPAWLPVNLPEGEQYKGEVVDAWEMTVTPLVEPVIKGMNVPLLANRTRL